MLFLEYGFDQGATLRAIRNKSIYKNCYWSYNSTINISEFKSEFKYKFNNKLYRTQKELGTELNLAKCTIGAHINNNTPINGKFIEIL